MKKLILMLMLCFIVFAVSANAATSFSDSLTGYSGNTFDSPAILADAGQLLLEPSNATGGWWHHQRIDFDATGVIFGTCGNGEDRDGLVKPTQIDIWKGINTLRTTDVDYNTTSFTAEVTVLRLANALTADDSLGKEHAGAVYFGMGTADQGYKSEPDKQSTASATIQLELIDGKPDAEWGTQVANPDFPTTGYAGIYTDIGSADIADALDVDETRLGLMRLRMEFDAVAETVAYSIDYGVDGTYEDQFAAFSVSDVLAQMALGDRASIYFGTDDFSVMTDFSVVVVPEPATLALLGLGGLLRRKRK
jgi:opacity protein-like surface antigen